MAQVPTFEVELDGKIVYRTSATGGGTTDEAYTRAQEVAQHILKSQRKLAIVREVR